MKTVLTGGIEKWTCSPMGSLTLYLSANRVDLEYLLTLTHTYTHTHTRSSTHAHTRTHTHTCMHTHTHTHTHLKFPISSTSTPTSRLGVSRSSCGRTRTCRAIGSASCRYSCGDLNNNNRILLMLLFTVNTIYLCQLFRNIFNKPVLQQGSSVIPPT